MRGGADSTAPVADTGVNGLNDLLGSASDANLAYYQLHLRGLGTHLIPGIGRSLADAACSANGCGRTTPVATPASSSSARSYEAMEASARALPPGLVALRSRAQGLHRSG